MVLSSLEELSAGDAGKKCVGPAIESRGGGLISMWGLDPHDDRNEYSGARPREWLLQEHHFLNPTELPVIGDQLIQVDPRCER